MYRIRIMAACSIYMMPTKNSDTYAMELFNRVISSAITPNILGSRSDSGAMKGAYWGTGTNDFRWLLGINCMLCPYGTQTRYSSYPEKEQSMKYTQSHLFVTQCFYVMLLVSNTLISSNLKNIFGGESSNRMRFVAHMQMIIVLRLAAMYKVWHV